VRRKMDTDEALAIAAISLCLGIALLCGLCVMYKSVRYEILRNSISEGT